MCNKELIPLINKYQKGNSKDFKKIYNVFKRLIYYYAYKVKYDEEIVQEFNVFLVELLYKIPLDKFDSDETYGLKKYISVAIRNKYILYSKTKQINENMCADYCEQIAAYNSSHEGKMIVFEGLSSLTDKQKQVIIYKYICGYSDFEISKGLHISRQAVNRLKTRGLLLLKAFLEKE